MGVTEFRRSWLLGSVVHALIRAAEEPAEAARLLYEVLSRATPWELVHLEADYRARRYALGPLRLDGPAGEDAQPGARVAVSGRHATAVAALMSFDRSGYVREDGVVRLAEAAEPWAIPFLLLRFNDPVEQVRTLAHRAVADRLSADHIQLVVDLLPVFDSLRKRRRASGLLAEVEVLLHRDGAGAEALRWGITSGDPQIRVCSLWWLARIDPVTAIETAFATRDASLWQDASRLATSSRLTRSQQEAVLPYLERNANPRTRLRALKARIRLPESDAPVRRAILDRDARVRYLARATLYARGEKDLTPQAYRDALTGEQVPEATVIGALGGLADTGTVGDVPRVLAFVSHAKVRVRAEAWRALGLLAPQVLEARLPQLAADPSAKVRRYLPSGPPPA